MRAAAESRQDERSDADTVARRPRGSTLWKASDRRRRRRRGRRRRSEE
jgi:hypothetical protein